MPKFIEFKKLNEKTVFINPEAIVAIQYRNEQESILHCQGLSTAIAVNHTQDEVLKMINDTPTKGAYKGSVAVSH